MKLEGSYSRQLGNVSTVESQNLSLFQGQSYNETTDKDLDYNRNNWILYACLAVITILAVVVPIVLCKLIHTNTKLRNDLAVIKNALGVAPTSPNVQTPDDENLQAHYQNTRQSVIFSPNYYYEGNDQNSSADC